MTSERILMKIKFIIPKEKNREVLLDIPGCMRETDVVQIENKLYRITEIKREGGRGYGTLSFHKDLEKRTHC
jgi:hypothetical protein